MFFIYFSFHSISIYGVDKYLNSRRINYDYVLRFVF